MAWEKAWKPAWTRLSDGSATPAVATALPTANLYAQFDANDTANHTPASGLWSPTAGSDTVDLIFKDGSDVTQTFGYAASPQNGLSLISVPTLRHFRAATTSTTGYADTTVLMAYRFVAIGSTGIVMSHGHSNSSYYHFLYSSADVMLMREQGSGGDIRCTQTGIGTADSAMRVLGYTVSNTYNEFLVLSHGAFAKTENALTSANIFDLRPRDANTYYGKRPGETASVEIGEILIYTTSGLGQAIQAIQYLKDRWGVTT